MKKYIMLSDRGKCVIFNRVKPIYFLKKLFLCGKNIQDIYFHSSTLPPFISSLAISPPLEPPPTWPYHPHMIENT